MPPLKSFHLYLHGKRIDWGLLGLVAHVNHGIDTTSTTDKHLSFILRIQIQKYIPAQESRLQSKSTRQPGLFIHGKQTFDRSMCDVGRSQHGHLSRHTNPVISTKSGSFSTYPFSIHIGLYRIFIKIMYRI